METPLILDVSSVSLDKLEGLLSPRADVVKPPRGDPALSPWKVESEKGLRASQVGNVNYRLWSLVFGECAFPPVSLGPAGECPCRD